MRHQMAPNEMAPDERLDTGEIAERAAAEHYVAKICFKTGPPRKIGVELEWTVHHRDDPSRPLEAATLVAALGRHAPATLQPDSSHVPLPHGGVLTVEPGGQVEISTPPSDSPATLFSAVAADTAYLQALLASAGLVLGDEACDPHRAARRILHTPRYAAMERAYDRRGRHGRIMMGGTASAQVCLDAGTPERFATRWRAVRRRRSGAPRRVRQLAPARRPAAGLGVRADAGLVRHRPVAAPGPRRRVTIRPPTGRGRRSTAACSASGIHTVSGTHRRRHLRRLDRRCAAVEADLRRPRLSPQHAVSAGPPARLPRGPLPRRAARATTGWRRSP